MNFVSLSSADSTFLNLSSMPTMSYSGGVDASTSGCRNVGSIISTVAASIMVLIASPPVRDCDDCLDDSAFYSGISNSIGHSSGSSPDHPNFISTNTSPSLRSTMHQSESIEIIQAPAWVASAYERIDELASRPFGWKGEGSAPPSLDIVNAAKMLIGSLSTFASGVGPTISAEEDGELNIHWRGRGGSLAIAVDGRARYSYYLNSGGQEYFGDDHLISGYAPTEIARFLQSFA